MEEVEVDTIDENLADVSQVRLSDVELPFKLGERNSRLAPLDSVIQEYTFHGKMISCLLYTSPSPRDATLSRMPSSA